jgi:branched-chain amino acid transport system permease protein
MRKPVRSSGTWKVPMVSGVSKNLLMVVVLFYRRGLMGTNEFSWDFFWKKRSAAVKGGARGGK